MPLEALLLAVTTWGLAALALLATQYACLVTRTKPKEQKLKSALTCALLLGWIFITAALATSGVLANFGKMPPPFLVFLLACILATFALAYSPLGTLWSKNLPLTALIGFQVFRVLAEVVLYLGYRKGFVPIQMTFEGWNMDILTGITAIPVALYLRKHPSRRLALVWNVLGLVLLINIVTIALVSAPTPLRLFMNEPANTFVTRFPFIWLPAVLVPFALLGHLLCFRRLAK